MDKHAMRSKLTMYQEQYKLLTKRKRHSEAAALFNKEIAPLKRKMGL